MKQQEEETSVHMPIALAQFKSVSTTALSGWIEQRATSWTNLGVNWLRNLLGFKPLPLPKSLGLQTSRKVGGLRR